MTNDELHKLRKAVANYMRSEGCSCCGDYDQHHADAAVLGKLLDVVMYSDKSGYNFSLYGNKKQG